MDDQIQEPIKVNKMNLGIFIFSNPAGTDIISLIIGITRPIKTALSPYFSFIFKLKVNQTHL